MKFVSFILNKGGYSRGRNFNPTFFKPTNSTRRYLLLVLSTLKLLSYIHDKLGIVHRDIKPIIFVIFNFCVAFNYFVEIFCKICRNIFISGRKLVLGDPGHAKFIIGSSKSRSNNNLNNFGTSNYLPPEVGVCTYWAIKSWTYGNI